MKKIIVAVIVFLSAVSFSSNASALVDIDARYWFTDLDSSVQASSGSVTGTELDFVSDLGVKEKKDFLEGRITLEFGGHKLRYSYLPMKWEGSSTLTQNITFGGQTYTASSGVNSSLKVDYHRFGYEYDIIDTLDNRLGIIFEVKYFDGEARLDSASLGLSESQAINIPIPAIGVTGQVSLPYLFSVGGEVTGITLGKNAYLFDGEAAISIKPAPFVSISAGYRMFKMHVEQDLDKADLTVKGPFVNLRADF